MSFVAGEQIGRVVGGRFRLEALVGRGASAEVYLAVDTRLRRRVAVKVLHPGMADDPQFVRRFRTEAQLASRLTHPNIVVIHDWHDGRNRSEEVVDDATQAAPVAPGPADEPAYLITEFLDGGSLRSMLDEHRRLSLSQVALIGIEAARALSYAHGQGIVHRDIKPANLLFAADGSLRIGDFGLARAIAEAALTSPDGSLVGTARYSAPEQANGSLLDGRADVYALAVTLIEAATGEAPFRADTPIGVLMARQSKPLIPPESMGVVGEALLSAGAVNPTDRIDAAELLRRLERCTRTLPRPDRLPLVITKGLRSIADSDPTVHQGATVAEVVTPPPITPAHAEQSAGSYAGVLSDPATIEADHALVGFDAGLPPHNQDPGPENNQLDNELEVDSNDRETTRSARMTRRRVLVGGLAVLAVGSGGAVGTKRYLDSRPVYRTVPNAVGLDATAAQSTIESLQLGWSESSTFDESVPVGQVISQSPISGVEVLRDSVVTAVVSGGPLPRPVPTLVGLSEPDALAAAIAVQLSAVVRDRPFDEVVPEGQVVAADPSAGEVPRDSTISIDVSAGAAPREVPNLSGMTPDQAKAALPDGLAGVIVGEPSETVAAGVVIAANYKPTTQLPRGSTIKIIVSTGPALITVPATKGLDVLAASQALRDAGLVVEGVEGSPDQPVLGSRPGVNQQVKRGTAVIVITGPQ